MSAPRTRVVATVALGLLALTACGTGASDAPAASQAGETAAPVPGGTFRIGTNGQEPTCLYPHSNSSTLGPILTVAFSDSLGWPEADGTLVP